MQPYCPLVILLQSNNAEVGHFVYQSQKTERFSGKQEDCRANMATLHMSFTEFCMFKQNWTIWQEIFLCPEINLGKVMHHPFSKLEIHNKLINNSQTDYTPRWMKTFKISEYYYKKCNREMFLCEWRKQCIRQKTTFHRPWRLLGSAAATK